MSYTVQSILISKDIPIEEARKHALSIIKKAHPRVRKVKKEREYKNNWRFRVIPKTKFVPRSFRSKKVNDQITLVFAQLKPEFESLKGSGFFDFIKDAYEKVKDVSSSVVNKVKDVFSPKLDDYSNYTKANLEKYGSKTIRSMRIVRQPVMSAIDSILNTVSVGKWASLKKKYGFDKFFHLGLEVDLQDGKKLTVEKLDIVEVSDNNYEGKGVDKQEVPLKGKQFTLMQLLDTARKNVGDKKFFEYDAFQNNCQWFVSYLLQGQNLYGPKEKEFVFQDIKELVSELPDYVSKFQRGITDVSATIKKLIGYGEDDESEDSEDEGKIEDIKGGSKASGFIRALIAAKASKNKDVKQEWQDRYGDKADKKNKKKFGKFWNHFNFPKMNMFSLNLVNNLKSLMNKDESEDFDKSLKRYVEFIKKNAGELIKTTETELDFGDDKKRYKGLMWDNFVLHYIFRKYAVKGKYNRLINMVQDLWYNAYKDRPDYFVNNAKAGVSDPFENTLDLNDPSIILGFQKELQSGSDMTIKEYNKKLKKVIKDTLAHGIIGVRDTSGFKDFEPVEGLIKKGKKKVKQSVLEQKEEKKEEDEEDERIVRRADSKSRRDDSESYEEEKKQEVPKKRRGRPSLQKPADIEQKAPAVKVGRPKKSEPEDIKEARKIAAKLRKQEYDRQRYLERLSKK